MNPNDADFDGVNNNDDFCSGTAALASVNEFGCSSLQILSGSGGGNGNGLGFQCIDPVSGASSDDENCPLIQKDSDFDGVVDGSDPYPLQDGTLCYP